MKNLRIVALSAGVAIALGLVACAPPPGTTGSTGTHTPPPMSTHEDTEQAPLPTPTVHTLVINEVRPMAYPEPDESEGEDEDRKPVRISPPNATDVFELISEERQIPGGDTRYLAAHAVGPTSDKPPGPGNLWADLRVGDRVVVEGETYAVTAVEETPKAWGGDLNARFKERVPGRLLLITCVPLEQGGIAKSNRVIWTQKVES